MMQTITSLFEQQAQIQQQISALKQQEKQKRNEKRKVSAKSDREQQKAIRDAEKQRVIARIRLLAGQGMTCSEISRAMAKPHATVYHLCKDNKIEVQTYSSDLYFMPVDITDAEICARSKAYAKSLGINNECVTRKATAEELRVFDGIKPYKHGQFVLGNGFTSALSYGCF